MLFGLELWMALSVFPSDIRSSVAQSIGDPRVISRRRRTASARGEGESIGEEALRDGSGLGGLGSWEGVERDGLDGTWDATVDRRREKRGGGDSNEWAMGNGHLRRTFSQMEIVVGVIHYGFGV